MLCQTRFDMKIISIFIVIITIWESNKLSTYSLFSAEKIIKNENGKCYRFSDLNKPIFGAQEEKAK